ncbi:MAG: glycine zipper 2TM domain-containing protein [Alteraurantiacibacter sp.]
MSKRLAFLAAASPLALFAAPVQAQVHAHDDRYAEVEEVIETYSEPVVQDIGDWDAEAGASYAHGDYGASEDYYEDEVDRAEVDEADWREVRHERRGYGEDHHGGDHGRDHMGGHHGMAGMAPGQPRQLAYGAAERAEWLSQCRALHADYDEPVYVERERDRNGGMVGSVLGAVAGGVVGNRVAHRGDRLAGTLIGAGVGGFAGAVIGSVIDNIGDDDDDDYYYADAPQEQGFDYCEAYLINYERGYGTPQMAYAPVMMVPVAAQAQMQAPMHAHGARRVIIEEIEIEADEAPRHHSARRVIHRQTEGDKRTPIR